MAVDEVYEFAVTTPAGTPSTAPIVTPTVFPARIVERIEWRAPFGSLGFMGWRISMRGAQVIPRNAGAFVVAHETAGGWDLRKHPDSGDWSVTTYNAGAFPHTLYLTFYTRVIEPAVPELALADDSGLYGDPDPAFAGG